MRKFAILAILVLFASIVAAEDIRIGYIDSNRLRSEFKEFKDAEDLFKGEVETKTLEAQKKRTELQDKQAEYEKQKLILSPEKQKEKEAELEALMEEYQKYVAANFDEQGELKRRSDELLAPILDKVNKAVKLVATEAKYTVVFDVASPSILYFKDSYDITESVLKELRK